MGRFLVALESDVGDVQGGTTKEGIHMGVMSGTLDLIQRAYLGGEIRGDTLYFDPKETERLDGLSLAMQFRGLPLESRSAAASSRWPPRATASVARSRWVWETRCTSSAPATASRSAPTRGGAAMATGFRGAIFDVDGVLVDSPHERAWREAFRR